METLSTPRRCKDSGSRKSLFGSCGASPLSSPVARRLDSPLRSERSPSWNGSPIGQSNLKSPNRTPVKRLENDFTQMALTRTPENRIGIVSARRSPRVLGVRPLSPDRGLITPKTFYGKAAVAATDGKALYRAVRESVRVRLPMETIPRERKRARSSDSKRPKKIPRLKLFNEAPRLGNTAKKVKSPTDAKKLKDKKKKVERKEPGKKQEDKKDEPIYNWQFFNSKTPPSTKVSRMFSYKSPSVLTPPPTSKKRKLISSYDLDHLGSPRKSKSPSPRKLKDLSPRKRHCLLPDDIRAITDEFSDDDLETDINTEGERDVDKIIDNLNREVAELLGDDALEDIDSNDENCPININIDSSQTKKLFPVFSLDHKKRQEPDYRSPFDVHKVKRAKIDKNQLLLDAGQSNLRENECKVCGLFYVCGDDMDEAVHADYHSSCKALTFPNWKKARVVSEGGLTQVILVKRGDPKAWWDKVDEVMQVVDRELGIPSEMAHSFDVYLYVKKKMIIGCLSARPLTQAHRLLPNFGVDAELCSEETFPVRVGVSRIWVHPQFRRQGIASSLVDSLRRTYTFGEILKVTDLAFSAPTEDGKKFAAKYCRREDYLIYTFDLMKHH